VPAALIGRLAVDRRHQGSGLGAILLANAAKRAIRSDAAIYALLVDAKDETAASFYRHHGFVPFSTQPHSLYLPVASIRDLL
jgi:GNAT superfamily N-acetyltransferase